MEMNWNIRPLDQAAMTAARDRQAQLAKPPGSLGRLEDLSIQLAGITGRVHNKIEKKHLLVFAADNGVVAEGVSSAPQSVTLMQTINLTRHKTGASTHDRFHLSNHSWQTGSCDQAIYHTASWHRQRCSKIFRS